VGEFEEVLDFWFGELDESGRADAARSARWFRKDAAFDQEIATRFGALHAAVARGERDSWLSSPRGRLAYVIVLDQFSRNMFRDSARAFACDERALHAALAGIERGVDRQLRFEERPFLYMPLMHSEDLANQERCVALFTAYRDEQSGALKTRVAGSLKYAEQHRDIIRRFGRFPHRNALLGRTSTGDEVEFLAKPGSSF
jgi:uncharacterized protein (DUF924 family)